MELTRQDQSIGHDITAVLDGNNSKPYVLNDYYESDLDEYKKRERFAIRFREFSEGNHNPDG